MPVTVIGILVLTHVKGGLKLYIDMHDISIFPDLIEIVKMIIYVVIRRVTTSEFICTRIKKNANQGLMDVSIQNNGVLDPAFASDLKDC